jgi:hypothetical protein
VAHREILPLNPPCARGRLVLTVFSIRLDDQTGVGIVSGEGQHGFLSQFGPARADHQKIAAKVDPAEVGLGPAAVEPVVISACT